MLTRTGGVLMTLAPSGPGQKDATEEDTDQPSTVAGETAELTTDETVEAKVVVGVSTPTGAGASDSSPKPSGSQSLPRELVTTGPTVKEFSLPPPRRTKCVVS